MIQTFRIAVLLSFIIHGSIFVTLVNETPEKEDIKPHKVTWLKLSKGDGGTNTKANFKKTKSLPKSTVSEQKKALKDLYKDRIGKSFQSHNPAVLRDWRW